VSTRIVVERLAGAVAKVVLDGQPLNLNTLDSIAELHAALDAIDVDEDIRCVVLSGAGSKAFCAGSDIKEFPSVWSDVVDRKLKRENAAFRRIETCAKPVIAAVDGIALGGGCELAMACDLRIASEGARFAFPEIKLGVFPGSGGLYRLPGLVGEAKAVELMMLGDPITAEQALQIGLVNQVVAPGRALEASLALATRIAAQPHVAVQAIKRGVRSRSGHHDTDLALTLELSDLVFRTPDCAEGVRAFFEKRPPRFGPRT
jgi:enoyl-CoA hydratase